MCDERRLIKHRRKFHRGTNNDYPCPVCAHKCLTRKKLQKHHKRYHVVNNPRKCHWCDEYFPTERQARVARTFLDFISSTFPGGTTRTPHTHGRYQVRVYDVRRSCESRCENGRSSGRWTLTHFKLFQNCQFSKWLLCRNTNTAVCATVCQTKCADRDGPYSRSRRTTSQDSSSSYVFPL